MEEGGDEVVHIKEKSNPGAPAPEPYDLDIEWSKAREVFRKPCGFVDHTCVALELPLKRATEFVSDTHYPTTIEGGAVVLMDVESGLMVQAQLKQLVQNHYGSYVRHTTYLLKRFTVDRPADPNLYKIPSGVRQVKELALWNASRMRKQLVGKPAPELAVADLKGKPISLAAYQGKTVLLDFWTTWCPPCRADAPDLEKLHQKYGKELVVIGVSVDEDRAVVEKFLKESVHSYPIVLTTENDMPRPYQVHAFPTYVVIDRNGNVTWATEGEKGFGELRSLLEKAGIVEPQR